MQICEKHQTFEAIE